MPTGRSFLLLSISPLLAAVLPESATAQTANADEAALRTEARSDTILRLALVNNPDLAEQRARVASARARTDQMRRLPDLQLKYEQWGVPLQRPFAVGEANAVMLGLSQTFPAPGTLDARARVADEDTATAAASEALRKRELRAQVRRGVADYYRADRELRLHREHVELTARLVELARASYRSGHRGQQDVLRLNLELSRLHRDLAHIEQERISAQALLNALMNRPVDAALGPPGEIDANQVPVAPDESMLESRRAEIAVAAAAVRRSEAALDLARREGRLPSVTVGADYMYMPVMEHRHSYGAMLMLNIPWLNAAKSDAVKASQSALQADRHALESVRNVVRYELRDARARYEAARSTFAIVDQNLMPQAQRNFEAAQSGYSAGQDDAITLVDSLRSFLDVSLDRVRALVHLETAAADLERAAGQEETVR